MPFIDLNQLPEKLAELHTQAGYLCDVHACLLIGRYREASPSIFGTSITLPGARRKTWTIVTCGQEPRLTAFEMGNPVSLRASGREIFLDILKVEQFATHEGKPVSEVTVTSDAQLELPMHPEDAAASSG